MSAAPPDVLTLLQGHLSGGTLTLDTTLFPEMTAALAVFGVTQLSVADVPGLDQPSPGDVTFDGSAAVLGVPATAKKLHGTVTTVGSAITVTLTLTPASAGRILPGVVPGLPDSFKPVESGPGAPSGPSVNTLQPSIAYDLDFTAVTLTASSGATSLTMAGTLKDTTAFEPVAGALGITGAPAVGGTLRLASGQSPPALDLELAGHTGTLPFGPLSVTDVAVRLHTVEEPADGLGPQTLVDVEGSLPLGGTLAATVVPQSDELWLTATFPPGGITLATGVSEFAHLVGLDSSDLSVPAGIPVLSELSLVGLTVIASTSDPPLRRVAVTVGLPADFPIVDGVVLHAFEVGWTVVMPTDPTKRDVSTSIAGSLVVGTGADAVTCDIEAYSDGGYTLFGSVANAEIDLEQLTKLAFGVDVPGLPTLDLSYADVSASTTGDYSLDVALAGWDIPLPTGTLPLYEVSAHLQRSAGTGSGTFVAVMGLGGGRLTVTADMPAADGGYSFSGVTSGDVAIDLKDIADDLLSLFKVSLPASVPDAVITGAQTTFDTKTNHFTFDLTGTVALGQATAGIELSLDLTPGTPYHLETKGTLTVGTRTFTLAFDETAGSTLMLAAYVDTGDDAIDLHDLADDLSSALGSLVPAGFSVDTQEALLMTWTDAAGREVAFALDLSAQLSLADLPLIGGKLPAGGTIGVHDVFAAYSSAALTDTLAGRVNALLPAAGPQLPTAGLPAGVSLAAVLDVAGSESAMSLGMPPPAPQPSSAGPTSAPAPAPTPAPPTSAPGGAWIDVQRQLGPVQFQRVGLTYQTGTLFLEVDAAIDAGPLTLSFDGLGLGSELSAFKPEFTVSGVGVEYSQPPLEIVGSILRVIPPPTGTKFQFDGSLVLSTEGLTLAAIGSYAVLDDGKASLFAMAQLEKALGGPPAFFVTGLMAGFGFNRSLAIPGQDEVLGFPLLTLNEPPEPGTDPAPQDPSHVLDVIEGRQPATPTSQPRAWIAPDPGEYWFALGVEFTSFELVHTRAVLIAELGDELTLALLGLSTLTLPQAEDSTDPYAYAELELEAVLKPSEGTFQLTAILSPNSYVLTPSCTLTGGFAFYTWFGSNPNAGQFVITLGGYHPAFTVPQGYPLVPRLGFNWAVSDSVSISGDAYFALTTSSIMAGGRLEALYNDGGLSAWFDASADVLVTWRPFSFIADICVDIGVSYRLDLLFCHTTISLSLGATVTMWGPPTGGTVYVHLWCVSFTVNFGDGRGDTNDVALEWSQFASLLPAAEHVVQLRPTGGVKTFLEDPSTPGVKTWVMRAAKMSFATEAAVPATHLCIGDAPNSDPTAGAVHTGTALDIRPMDMTALTSVHRLIVRQGSTTATPDPLTNWTLDAASRGTPDALWGRPPSPFTQTPAQPSADTHDHLIGFSAAPPPPDWGTEYDAWPIQEVSQETIFTTRMPLDPSAAASTHYVAAANPDSVGDIEGIAGVAGERSKLVAALTTAHLYTGPDDPLTAMATDAQTLFGDAPMEETVPA